MKRQLTALATSLLVASAWAQSTGKPLNLKLPPGDLPSVSSTAAKPASARSVSNAPGVYYGDTSGAMGDTGDDTAAEVSSCDDSTFNQPQVHGNISTGIVSGRHMGTGTWNAGGISISKNLGDCDDPGGRVNMSIEVGQGHFHGRRYGH